MPQPMNSSGQNGRMARYIVNPEGAERARKLIDARQYVLASDWGDSQPNADDENAFLESHTWAEYASWPSGPDRRRQGRNQGEGTPSCTATSAVSTGRR